MSTSTQVMPRTTDADAALRQAMAGPNTADRLATLAEDGRLFQALPELRAAVGCVQPPEHYYDVFAHTLATVRAAEQLITDPPAGLFPPDHDYAAFLRSRIGEHTRAELLKWAALLHDIGKPATRAPAPDGRIHFFGHSALGVELALPHLLRLGFGEAERQHIAQMIRYHLRPGVLSETWPPTRRAVARYFREVGEAAIDTLLLNLADHIAARGAWITEAEIAEHATQIRDIMALQFTPPPPRPPRPITGEDVMAVLGLPPGPAVGAALRAVQAAGLTDRAEALAFLERWRTQRDPQPTTG